MSCITVEQNCRNYVKLRNTKFYAIKEIEKNILNKNRNKRAFAFLYSHQTHSSVNRRMINVEDRYFSIHRTLLLTIGLWPYQKSKLARIQFVCLFSILLSCIMFQVSLAIFLSYYYITYKIS